MYLLCIAARQLVYINFRKTEHIYAAGRYFVLLLFPLLVLSLMIFYIVVFRVLKLISIQFCVFIVSRSLTFLVHQKVSSEQKVPFSTLSCYNYRSKVDPFHFILPGCCCCCCCCRPSIPTYQHTK